MNNDRERNDSHFVICDSEKEYSEKLCEMLSEKFQESCQYHLFHDTERVKQFYEEHRVKYLLISKDHVRAICCLDEGENIWNSISEKSEYIFFLSDEISSDKELDDHSKNETGATKCLFRYQSVDSMIRFILDNKNIRMSLYSPKKKGQKKDKVKAHRIRAEPVMRGLIGIYSPVHRIGKTRFALRLGRRLAEESHVLYLNLEGYSGDGYYFPERKEKNLADLLYFMRQEETNFGVKISAMTGQSEKMDYIMPIENECDLRNIKREEWIGMINTIFEECIYEIIILDLGDSIDGLYDILNMCDRIYTLYLEEGAAMAKLDQYERTLVSSGYEEILKKTVKKRVKWAKRTEDRQYDPNGTAL